MAVQDVEPFAFALDTFRFYCDYFGPAYVDRIEATAESAVRDAGGDPASAQWAPFRDLVAKRAHEVREAVNANAALFRAITGASRAASLLDTSGPRKRVQWNLGVRVAGRALPPAPGDAPRALWRALLEAQPFVLQVLAQLKREWTAAGAEERAEGYGPLLEALEHWHATQGTPRDAVRVLVPGAGLGRLAWEIASRGFRAQANEDNTYMLVASFALMNALAGRGAGAFEICPDAHAALNTRSFAGPCRRLSFPDVDVSSVFQGEGEPRLTFAAGDFVETYGGAGAAGAWDVVVTAFFIDTGTNLVKYLATIARALRPGGLWINLGALLYNHYSETSPVPEADILSAPPPPRPARPLEPPPQRPPRPRRRRRRFWLGRRGAGGGPAAGRPFTVELTAEEVAAAAACAGLTVVERGHRRARYCAAADSMLRFEYDALFLLAAKPDS
eukprot:tig00001033_g6494.t1